MKHTTTSIHQSKPADIELLVRTAWRCAATGLWPATNFSQHENRQATEWIRFYFRSAAHPSKAFSAFFQRVLLARQYLRTHPDHTLPPPSEWLHPDNSKGFAGTRTWLASVEQLRKSLPRTASNGKLLRKPCSN